MEKPTMFIGSSTEGLPAAEAIKRFFDAELDVTLWKDEGVFKLNSSYLESLLRASSFFDFAILVVTPDDIVTSRGHTQAAPRDNVLFEHGLFLGRLGPRRAFIVCDKAAKILSDYAGITIGIFEKPASGALDEAVKEACMRIQAAIREAQVNSEIGVLPSTALAVGYFENFITKVVPALCDKRELTMRRKVKDAAGKDTDEQCALSYDSFTLHIVIPDTLSQITHGSLQLSVSKLVHITIQTPFRGFPFYIRTRDYSPQPKGALSAFDIPTTLLASRRAIKLILGGHVIGLTTDQEKLERREIRNFKQTLELLIEEEYGKDNSCVKVETMSYLKTL